MKVSSPMLKYCLDQIIHGYLADHDQLPEDDMSALDVQMNVAKLMADANGDREWVELGLRQLVHGSDEERALFGSSMHNVGPCEVRVIAIAFLSFLKAPLDAPAFPVTFEPITGEEWKSYKDSYSKKNE